MPQSTQVVISTATFIISTSDELQEVLKPPPCTYHQDEAGKIKFPKVRHAIEVIDNFVVIFFTVEFLVRIAICPNKKR